MKTRRPRFPRGRRRAAFSLVEVALALGIVGFALVGIVGAIPMALNNGRLSIAQTRAANVAGTIFTNFRTQPFSAVQYLDASAAAATLDLDVMVTTNATAKNDPVHDPLTFYAAFDEVPSAANANDAQLHFSATPTGAPCYTVVLRFDNHPAGMLAPYQPAPNAALHAQGSGIEASIFETDRPGDVFRFDSVIANRSQ